MAWVWLMVASACEVGWAVLLKYSQGFTRPAPTAGAVIVMIASFVFLSLAVRDLPVGTAYAIWTGLGAVGVAVLGMILLGEPHDLPRLLSLALIVAGIVGLRIFSPS